MLNNNDIIACCKYGFSVDMLIDSVECLIEDIECGRVYSCKSGLLTILT